MHREGVGRFGSAWPEYKASLRAGLPFNRLLNRRILDEISDHMAEATTHWLDQGLPRDEAEQRAITQLGPPDEVVLAFARSKGLGMATATTKLSGLSGAIAPFALLLGYALFNADGGDPIHWLGSGLMFASLGMLVFFFYGLWKRHAGALGGWGKAALWLAIASPLLSIPFAWGAPIALMGYLAGSFVLMGVGIWRAGRLPRAPMALCALGPLFMLAIGGTGAWVGFDGGKYFVFGMIPTTLGLMWLGVVLWKEPREDGAFSETPPAVA